MRDDEVLALRYRALQHIESAHYRRRYAAHGRLRVSRLEHVSRRCLPRYADLFLNAIDDLLRGDFARRGSSYSGSE
jgi:hypothetical protein